MWSAPFGQASYYNFNWFGVSIGSELATAETFKKFQKG